MRTFGIMVWLVVSLVGSAAAAEPAQHKLRRPATAEPDQSRLLERVTAGWGQSTLLERAATERAGLAAAIQRGNRGGRARGHGFGSDRGRRGHGRIGGVMAGVNGDTYFTCGRLFGYNHDACDRPFAWMVTGGILAGVGLWLLWPPSEDPNESRATLAAGPGGVSVVW